MTIITIYALFGDDIRILTVSSKGDPFFYVINIFAMILFGAEVIVASIVKEDYFNGFFFWLDFISTISLIMDIGWLTDLMFSSGGSA